MMVFELRSEKKDSGHSGAVASGMEAREAHGELHVRGWLGISRLTTHVRTPLRI
jgi:hypothetical protein